MLGQQCFVVDFQQCTTGLINQIKHAKTILSGKRKEMQAWNLTPKKGLKRLSSVLVRSHTVYLFVYMDWIPKIHPVVMSYEHHLSALMLYLSHSHLHSLPGILRTWMTYMNILWRKKHTLSTHWRCVDSIDHHTCQPSYRCIKGTSNITRIAHHNLSITHITESPTAKQVKASLTTASFF